MTMTTFQAMALLAFACKKEAVAFPEICEHMQIDEPTGKRFFTPLCVASINC